MGVTNIDAIASGHGVDRSEDSFERYYNKDLDLDEGKLTIKEVTLK